MMIEVRDLHKTYGKAKPFEALRGIDLAVGDGECLAVVGKSGSGKSTLLHLMAGLDTPTSGTVQVGGRMLNKLGDSELAAMRNESFGFIFQRYFLLPRYSVLENVALPLMIRDVGRADRERRATGSLAEVGLSDKAGNRATDLSGGEQQRAVIARALVIEPNMIFADEPTGNLDSETGEQVVSLMFDIQKRRGLTMVMVTHDFDLAGRCDRTVTVRDGRIIEAP